MQQMSLDQLECLPPLRSRSRRSSKLCRFWFSSIGIVAKLAGSYDAEQAASAARPWFLSGSGNHIGDEPFCAAVVYFLLHTEPFVPDGQDDKIKILNSTR